MTLPEGMDLTPEQQEQVENHIHSLRSLLGRTPEASPEAEADLLLQITNMMLVLPSQRTSETGAEARGEAYMDALDDVPAWAVRGGLRKWYRGECGMDENGKSYDYHWAPGPAELRRVSLGCLTPVRARILELERLLTAVPFKDCTAELRRGQAAWLGLRIAIKDGRDIKSLTFDQAVDIADDAAPKAEAAE